MLGGGMRQAGVLAAAGILALTEQVQHLPTDHANAQALANALAGMHGLEVNPDAVQTNMVFVRIAGDARQAIIDKMAQQGVLVRNFHSTAGLENCLRITVGSAPENARLMQLMEAWQP